MNESSFQTAHELGKIYHSLLDKTGLCEFFLESASLVVKASEGFLFLAGTGERLWLAATNALSVNASQEIAKEAEAVFQKGQPLRKNDALYIPLIVSNGEIGVACFVRKQGDAPFEQKDLDLSIDLGAQLAGALKNVLLHEENLKMARMATIGQMSGMVLHEIKNLVQLAQVSYDYIQMGIKKNKPEYVDKAAEVIKKFLRDTDGFVYEMLSLTKDYKLKPQKVNFKSLLAELQGNLVERAKQFNTQLDFGVEEPFPDVDGETRSLYRTLLNLAKNAVEAADSHKKDSYVRVRVKSKNETHYEIIVEDNGKGMNDEVKARLFQAFLTTKGEGGTGLGLLVIDRTVKAHKGEIKFESEYTKGTKFVLTLPKTISE